MLKSYKYEELNSKKDEELLRIIGEEGGAMSGSPAHGVQEQNRELVKAILNVRSANLTSKQIGILISLTKWITALTVVSTILGIILVVKGCNPRQ